MRKIIWADMGKSRIRICNNHGPFLWPDKYVLHVEKEKKSQKIKSVFRKILENLEK